MCHKLFSDILYNVLEIKGDVMAKKETGANANFGETGRIKKISLTSENIVQLR